MIVCGGEPAAVAVAVSVRGGDTGAVGVEDASAAAVVAIVVASAGVAAAVGDVASSDSGTTISMVGVDAVATAAVTSGMLAVALVLTWSGVTEDINGVTSEVLEASVAAAASTTAVEEVIAESAEASMMMTQLSLESAAAVARSATDAGFARGDIQVDGGWINLHKLFLFSWGLGSSSLRCRPSRSQPAQHGPSSLAVPCYFYARKAAHNFELHFIVGHRVNCTITPHDISN